MQYQQIKSITVSPNQDVYYISVRKNANFIGNNVVLHNCGYRGDLGVKLYNLTAKDYNVKKGDRIAQFKIEKVWESTVEFIDAAVETARGAGGFGSSGK